MAQSFLPFILVGLGSMLGGITRYCLTLATVSISVSSIPYGTLLSNTAGCLVIGIIAGVSGKAGLLSGEMRLLLATGFCGGFTTMSAFVLELAQFVQDQEFGYATGYFLVTMAGASLAFAVGLLLTNLVLR